MPVVDLRPSKTRISRWFYVRRGAVALVILLAVSELTLRALGYASFVQFRRDERLLWVPVPGRDRLTVVNHQPITISDDGFRYPGTLGPKPAGEKRVFVFGDSVTMGWGVDDQSHYSAVLEQLLATSHCGRPARVVSAGVNAYPNYLVVERMKKVFEDKYQPDVVVLAYSFNVAFERLPLLQGNERERFLQRVEWKSTLRNVALYNFLVEDVLRNAVYYRLRTMLVEGSWETGKPAPDTQNLVAGFSARLAEAKHVCESHGARLILLVLPSTNQKTELHPFQSAMLAFAQQEHTPAVNIIDAFRSLDHGPLFMDHVHPNATGHRLIAEQLSRPVEEQLGCSAR